MTTESPDDFSYDYGYATDTDVSDYFFSHPRSATWSAASWNAQNFALNTAARLMDRLPFTGYPTSSTQRTAWPRVIRPSRDHHQAIPSDVIPHAVRDAFLEWALDLIVNDPSKSKAVVIHRQVGDLQTDYAPMLPDTLPPLVRAFLQPYLRTSANTAEIAF